MGHFYVFLDFVDWDQGWAIAHFKSATKSAKNVRISKSHFFRTLKRAIAHFQSVRLPNPDWDPGI